MTDEINVSRHYFLAITRHHSTRVVVSSRPSYRVYLNHSTSQGAPGPAGQGMPTGGTVGQVLTKDSATDYDTSWQDPGSSAVTSVNAQTGVVVLDTDDIGEGATNLYHTQARVSANTDVAANTAARHTHANAAQLALVTDGDHDVRTDNPHNTTAAQVGAAAASHGHALSDLTQSGATDGQVPVWNQTGGVWVPGDQTGGGGGISDAPSDGTLYGRKNAAWAAAAEASHSHTAANISDFDTEVSNNTDVAANTAARHTHTNQAQLDLVTDGDHDVRTDNPHATTAAQVGAAAASHTHALADLTQSSATDGQAAVWNGSAWAPGDLPFAVSSAVYADVAGSDTTGDGTIEHPYQSIQAAVDAASPGDTVIVIGAGTFAGIVTCKDGVDIYAPNATLELNDGDHLELAFCKVVVRKLIRTSGSGPLVDATNATGYGILIAFEINDTGTGDTIVNTNEAPLDLTFSQAYVGTGASFLVDSSTGRHVHMKGEDIYLTASGSKVVTLTNGGTVLATVHHIKELGAGVGLGTVFNIVDGDVNVSAQEIGAATLATIGADGNLNISAQDVVGAVTNNGVYTYFYNNIAGVTKLGSNLGTLFDALSYKLTGLAGNSGAFLTLGADGLIVPATLDVGAVTWEDLTEAFSDINVTTEMTVYSVTVDQSFTAGSIEYRLDVTFPYWRTTTMRVYHGATLIDTQAYTGAGSPLSFTGAVPITAAVTSGDVFTVTVQSSEADAFEPNRSDVIDGGYLRVTKTGNTATPAWGSITGTIADQTDLIGEFLSRTNTGTYTPTADYHPATKKYVDDSVKPGVINFLFGDGTNEIAAGIVGWFKTPNYAITLTAYRLMADVSGNLVIDIWADTFANFPPTDADSITASNQPTLSGTRTVEDITITDWTEVVPANSILMVNVDSASGVKQVLLALEYTR